MKQKAEALEAELKTVTKQNEEQSLTGRITAQVSSLLTAAGVKLMPTTAAQPQGASGGYSLEVHRVFTQSSDIYKQTQIT
jgi:hypothetical protein